MLSVNTYIPPVLSDRAYQTHFTVESPRVIELVELEFGFVLKYLRLVNDRAGTRLLP